MATFALGAGNLVEVAIETETGSGTTAFDEIYVVPTGFYVELVDVSLETRTFGTGGYASVVVRKTLLSGSDYVDYGVFKHDNTETLDNDAVIANYVGTYTGGEGSDLTRATFWQKINDGFILYAGDRVFIKTNNYANEYKSRIMINIYKNP